LPPSPSLSLNKEEVSRTWRGNLRMSRTRRKPCASQRGQIRPGPPHPLLTPPSPSLPFLLLPPSPSRPSFLPPSFLLSFLPSLLPSFRLFSRVPFLPFLCLSFLIQEPHPLPVYPRRRRENFRRSRVTPTGTLVGLQTRGEAAPIGETLWRPAKPLPTALPSVSE
jgi:hypothetical protein